MKRSSNKTRGNKGFYAALGISAVMIGSACYFAYDQGNKIADEYRKSNNSIAVPKTAVDKKVPDIPKITTVTAYLAGSLSTAKHSHPSLSAVMTTPTTETEPVTADVMEEVDTDTVETALSFDSLLPPLADISNIVTPFSGSELVKNETTGSWQTHNGTDIAAEMGAEVFAVADGEVVSVNNDALWGVTVMLDHHNGFTTKYCSLGADLSVQQGDELNGGDIIGVVGGTADIESASPSHLHIEVKHNGKFIDPLTAIK